MSEILTIDRKEFKKLLSRLDHIERFVIGAKKEKWITEEEAMQLTGLGKSALRKKRAAGIFSFSSATGRKIKYLRKEIDDYIDDNSIKKALRQQG